MIEDIYDAVQTSATPTQLAAALSPILDASFALDTLEEEMVQAALSVSQSSAEYWYDNNYSQMAVVASEASSELAEGCANGTMQGQTYESSGLSWQCQNLQWLQIAFKLKQSDGYFRFASLPLGTSFSCPSVGALYAGIAFADAAGAVYGAVRGWRLGLIGVAISGAWRAAQFSGGGAWTALGVDLFCNVF